VICRESLSELTSAVALSRCENKQVTHRVLSKLGVRVPAQQPAGDARRNQAFLEKFGRVVVKPSAGEQGRGVSVDLDSSEEVEAAVRSASEAGDNVLLEEYVPGMDLRVVVIDYRVVAAALRKPAAVTGNGRDEIRTLIEKQSRRRAAATGGESRIPLDAETERCVMRAGYAMEDVLEHGKTITVRSTANLHTGGTLEDVTDVLNDELSAVAVRCAEALDIPVVGLDFIVPDATSGDYAFIEANERPGLANHEPQPTAERFVDLLFPQTAAGRDDRSEGQANNA
jgi:GNAT-family acetyltransferase (TIGR03103 family)